MYGENRVISPISEYSFVQTMPKELLPHLHDSDENVSKISTREHSSFSTCAFLPLTMPNDFFRCRVISEMENSISGREKSFFSFVTLMGIHLKVPSMKVVENVVTFLELFVQVLKERRF
jgi:hypothetical protein